LADENINTVGVARETEMKYEDRSMKSMLAAVCANYKDMTDFETGCG